MNLIHIYQCLCDRTRLRILNLLREGPRCVCHLQSVLGEPQVKVSKHLRYLKARHLVEVSKSGNWRFYQLSRQPSRALVANLRCLQDSLAEDDQFKRDLARLAKMHTKSSARCAISNSGSRKKPTTCDC